jgi:hypothetical protein
MPPHDVACVCPHFLQVYLTRATLQALVLLGAPHFAADSEDAGAAPLHHKGLRATGGHFLN